MHFCCSLQLAVQILLLLLLLLLKPMDRGFSLIQSRRAALEAFPNHVLKLDYVGFDSSDKKNTLFSAHSWNKTDYDLEVQHPSKIVVGFF